MTERKSRPTPNEIKDRWHYPRTPIIRVGHLELRVPQDRQGRFSSDPICAPK
jgi:transposase-like protein